MNAKGKQNFTTCVGGVAWNACYSYTDLTTVADHVIEFRVRIEFTAFCSMNRRAAYCATGTWYFAENELSLLFESIWSCSMMAFSSRPKP